MTNKVDVVTTFLTISVIFGLISGIAGLECYSCFSSRPEGLQDRNCENGNRTGMKVDKCSEGLDYCSVSKIRTNATQTTPEGLTVKRSCSATGMSTSDDLRFCKSDLCNHGNRHIFLPLESVLLCLVATLIFGK